MNKVIALKVVIEKDEQLGRILEFECDSFTGAIRCYNALKLRGGERVIEVRMREEFKIV